MKQCLIIGEDAPIHDPAWDLVEAAARNVLPSRPVILCKQDKRRIRADGARFMYTIVFYRDAHAVPIIIGRPKGAESRGKATLNGQRVLVSPQEYWAEDGIIVFRAFFDDRPLEQQFVLRDPRAEYTPQEIRDFLR